MQDRIARIDETSCTARPDHTYGSIVPGPAYQSNGLQCRPYTHTIDIDGHPEVARGNACRNPDGTWTAVS